MMPWKLTEAAAAAVYLLSLHESTVASHTTNIITLQILFTKFYVVLKYGESEGTNVFASCGLLRF